MNNDVLEGLWAEIRALKRLVEQSRTLEVHHSSGWVSPMATWTYASATTFTVPGNVTRKYPVGAKIYLQQPSTEKFFYVTARSYSAPNTTVTVTGGSDYSLANVAIDSPLISYVENLEVFPVWFNWSPAWTNFTLGNGTQNARFKISGGSVFFEFGISLGSTSSVGTIPYFTVPIPEVSASSLIGLLHMGDTGVANYPGSLQLAGGNIYLNLWVASGTYVSFAGLTATTPFTWGTGDTLYGSGNYKL